MMKMSFCTTARSLMKPQTRSILHQLLLLTMSLGKVFSLTTCILLYRSSMRARKILTLLSVRSNRSLKPLSARIALFFVLLVGTGSVLAQAWDTAVGAFEHAESSRTSLFGDASPFAVSQGEPIAEAETGLPGLWSVAIDRNGRVFALGGVLGDAAGAAPYIAGLDPHTRKQLWRTPLPMVEDEQVWNYPGGIGVHSNGFVYVAYAARIAKLDPDSGKVLGQIDLPTPNGLAHTSYNGFILLSDGMILTKSHHRKSDCPVQGFRAFIVCGFDGLPPSALVMIDPATMQIVWTGKAEELIGGRISAMRYQEREYIYLAGLDKLYRMRRIGKQLIADSHWGPVAYREGKETPGTTAIGFGDFVVIQTNALPTSAPMRVTAISQSNAAIRHSIRPFEGAGRQWSFTPSKASSDWAARRIYTSEAYGGFAALDFDPKKGFSVAWKAEQYTGSFITLLGRQNERTVVASDIGAADSDDYGSPKHTREDLIWRRASDGKQLGRAKGLPRNFGLTLTPTKSGAIYYATGSRGLWHVTPPSGKEP
jgi:hypothetical protein